MTAIKLGRLLCVCLVAWLSVTTSSQAKFLQTDPAGYQDGMNWYAYVDNDPLNRTDPTGLQSAYLGPQPRNDDEARAHNIGSALAAVSAVAIGGTVACVMGGCAAAAAGLTAVAAKHPGATAVATNVANVVAEGPAPPRALPNSALVCRGGACTAGSFANGSGVTTAANGTLSGVSVQSKAGASVAELAQPFQHNQVGSTTAGRIRAAGGTITPDGGAGNPNHATVNGLTGQQLENLFTPTKPNPVPKPERGR